MKPYILKPHFTRKTTIMPKSDERVPKALFEVECIAPDLSDFPLPLPSKKSDYTCFAKGENGVIWYGATTGLTRYDENGYFPEDKIMYFSSGRQLYNNKVDAIYAQGDNAWVLTGDYVTFVEMIKMTCEEKADILLDETLNYVMRRGMVSQRDLQIPGDKESVFPYAASDNDGTFTAGFALGEMMHYAVFRDKYGEDDARTQEARRVATLACEGCLLLMYVHGRPEGFVSRSYHLTGEPVPDDGLFYKRSGKTAKAVETTYTKRHNYVGEEVPCDHPIPERLRKLFTDLGFTEDDITYKADTSSDEITSHFMQMRVAHDILGEKDPELDEIIKDACKRTMLHIINGGFELCEHDGRATTWAKWSKKYFENDPTGYVDAPLNSAEVLFYLKAVMHITGEKGIWQETYDKLVAEGYADTTTKHFDRFYQGAMREGCAPEEDLMYGDNMLALMTFSMICTLEEDEVLLGKYREALKSWKGTLLREHTPGYDFLYKMGCPDAEIDFERDAKWFYHFETNRLGGIVNMLRHDTPVKLSRGEENEWPERELSTLLMCDERIISKYDRNPFSSFPSDGAPSKYIESCYIYTMGYWLGRYYGFIAEED
ncbi:MAG: hypothetical protein KBT46_04945 [Ruminococcus sp.]|nr:hypothetical protein [Candidatus Copronaster equi]